MYRGDPHGNRDIPTWNRLLLAPLATVPRTRFANGLKRVLKDLDVADSRDGLPKRSG